MESTLQNPAFAVARTTPKSTTTVYWIVTAVFCLEMSFTAYYELLPQGLQAFTRVGFPNSYFRIELSLAKLAGVAALLIPLVPGAAQGVGIRRLRDQPRLGNHRPPLDTRYPAGIRAIDDHQRTLGAFVLLLAPRAGHPGELRSEFARPSEHGIGEKAIRAGV
jgi:hypothetical protein